MLRSLVILFWFIPILGGTAARAASIVMRPDGDTINVTFEGQNGTARALFDAVVRAYPNLVTEKNPGFRRIESGSISAHRGSGRRAHHYVKFSLPKYDCDWTLANAAPAPGFDPYVTRLFLNGSTARELHEIFVANGAKLDGANQALVTPSVEAERSRGADPEVADYEATVRGWPRDYDRVQAGRSPADLFVQPRDGRIFVYLTGHSDSVPHDLFEATRNRLGPTLGSVPTTGDFEAIPGLRVAAQMVYGEIEYSARIDFPADERLWEVETKSIDERAGELPALYTHVTLPPSVSTNIFDLLERTGARRTVSGEAVILSSNHVTVSRAPWGNDLVFRGMLNVSPPR